MQRLRRLAPALLVEQLLGRGGGFAHLSGGHGLGFRRRALVEIDVDTLLAGRGFPAFLRRGLGIEVDHVLCARDSRESRLSGERSQKADGDKALSKHETSSLCSCHRALKRGAGVARVAAARAANPENLNENH